MATRELGHSIWRSGYYEYIIRDDNDFLLRWQYIAQNPARWAEDKYFTEQTTGGAF